MAEYNISIDAQALENTFSEIEKDINELESILTNIYQATETLDDRKWFSNEKTKIDNEYVPYLKKVSEGAPLALRKQLKFARDALSKYTELEKSRTMKTEDLVDYISADKEA